MATLKSRKAEMFKDHANNEYHHKNQNQLVNLKLYHHILQFQEIEYRLAC